jgi:SAM-dependent methyltransferase
LAEFTGERLIPGEVDSDLFNEHVARYTFAARFAHGKRVLDAGCGAGYGSAELAKTARAVYGADVSAEAIHYARDHYRLPNLQFEQASCVRLPHPDASFDLVIAFEVIEHLEEWRKFLLEVKRVLSASGQFVVSTPNKLYYAESRRQAGPNPFHVHEFEFTEFRHDLTAAFPHVAMFLENHVQGVVFQPVVSGAGADVRIDRSDIQPTQSHFFVAVCGHQPRSDDPAFIYIPSAANVLREREQHIDLLASELKTKDAWLETAKQDLGALNETHQKLIEMFQRQKDDLEERNQWALQLNADLEGSRARIAQLQDELAQEHEQARAVVEGYEAKIAELEADSNAKVEWARRLDKEMEEKSQELAQCVQYLDQSERTVEERTLWARRLEAEANALQAKLAVLQSSTWVKVGRRLRLSPSVPAN